MQCEYRDNAGGRITAAESIADAWTRDGLDVDFREVDEETWRPLTHWQPYRPGTAARYAPPTPAVADPDEYVPPDPMLEIDRPTMALLGELADRRREDESAVVAAAVAAFHARTTGSADSRSERHAPTADATSHTNAGRPAGVPPQPTETNTMRIAVKSTGGITESFLHVENLDEGVREAARQLVEDYGLPTDIELWSGNADAGAPRRLGGFRFVAVTPDGNVVDLD